MSREKEWNWETIARNRRGDRPACYGNCFAGSKKAALRRARQITNRKVTIVLAPDP